MIPILLGLLAQATPAPSDVAGLERLHPAGAVLFVQVPKVQDLLRAYEKAPLVRMVRDETVGKSVEGLLESFELSASDMLAQAARAAGLPEPLAADPLAIVGPWAGMLQDFSLSLSIGEDLPAEDIARQLLALEQLRSLELHLEGHLAQHGKLPTELDELGVSELLKDPWGARYVYRVDVEKGERELRSLGADGRPGGAGIQRDLSAGELESLLGWATKQGHLLAIAHLSDPQAARLAAEALSKRLADAGATSERHERLFNGERAFQVLVDGGASGFKGWILQSGQLLAVGTGSLDALAARVAGSAVSLATGPGPRALREKLPPGEGAMVIDAYLDTESLHRVLTLFNPGMAAPLDGLRGALALRSRLHEGRFTTELATSKTRSVGWLSALGTRPLTGDMWRLLPEDAIAFYASSLDAGLLFDELAASVGADEAMLQEIESQHGFSIERDLFGSLGGAAFAYLLPVTALIAPPGAALVVEVKDAEAFRRGIDGLIQLLNTELADGSSIKLRPYRDIPLWTLSLPQGGGTFGLSQLSPSLALVPGHAILTLTSTRAKKEIKRALGEEGSMHALLDGPRKPPPEVVAFGYLDWPSLLAGVYGSARSLMSLAGGMMGEGMPIDPQSLPEAEVFVRFFEPSTLWTKNVGMGSYTRVEGSFGPEASLGVALLSTALFMGIATPARVETGAVESAIPETAVPDPAPQQIAITRSTLDYLRTRLAVYRLENQRYPPALGTLIESTPSYPKGYLKEQVLPPDAWGHALLYSTDAEGSTFKLWSMGPDGVDQQGQGDDVQG